MPDYHNTKIPILFLSFDGYIALPKLGFHYYSEGRPEFDEVFCLSLQKMNNSALIYLLFEHESQFFRRFFNFYQRELGRD